MIIKQLGRSEIMITPLILGTSAIGGYNWGGSDLKNDIQAIHTSIEYGVKTIDTAAIYGMGLCEERIGKAIKGLRHELILASKCGLRWDSSEGSDPWPQRDMHGHLVTTRRNSKPESIIYECEQSLNRLGTDVIDLYQIHWPDSTTEIEESWEAMVKLKRQGKVRAIGVSNYNLEQLSRAHAIYPVDSIQLPYSLVTRGIEEDLLPYCINKSIGIIVYSPLERGLLTGKISSSRQFPSNDQRSFMPIFSIENRQCIEEALQKLQPIASKYKATPSQLIINTLIHKKWIAGVIVGARNAEQSIENAEALNLCLTSEELELIENEFKKVSLS